MVMITGVTIRLAGVTYLLSPMTFQVGIRGLYGIPENKGFLLEGLPIRRIFVFQGYVESALVLGKLRYVCFSKWARTGNMVEQGASIGGKAWG